MPQDPTLPAADPKAPGRDAADVPPLDVAAIAPHPDDLEITCGGTLAKLVTQGYRVGIFDLTTGEPTPRGSLEKRAQEAENARQALGVQVRVNVGLDNRVLMDSPENRFKVATELRRYRPQIIITMAGRTPAASPDHHQGHLLVEASRFLQPAYEVGRAFRGHAAVPRAALGVRDHSVRRGGAALEGQLHRRRDGHVREEDRRRPAVTTANSTSSVSSACGTSSTGHSIALGGMCGYAFGEHFALPHAVGSQDLVQTVQTGAATMAPASVDNVGGLRPGQDHLPMG